MFSDINGDDTLGQTRPLTAEELARRYQTRLGKHTIRLDTLYPLLKAVSEPDTLAALLDLAEDCLRANSGVSSNGKRQKLDLAAFNKMRTA